MPLVLLQHTSLLLQPYSLLHASTYAPYQNQSAIGRRAGLY
jgi:hypothetical protein